MRSRHLGLSPAGRGLARLPLRRGTGRLSETPLTDGPGSLQGLRVIWRLYEAERRGVVADLHGLGLDEPWDIAGLDRLP